jgi:hypothetical protein
LRDAIICRLVMICVPMAIGSIVRCGCAAWPPRPLMVMVNSSVAAMIGALADRELADGQAGHVVHAVDLFDAEALHHAVLDHQVAAAAAFFGRLEDDRDVAGEIARLGEVFGGTEQHRRVAVMAAGMHLA